MMTKRWSEVSMPSDFETYTRDKITKLRADAAALEREASQLERLLGEFMKKHRPAGDVARSAGTPAVVANNEAYSTEVASPPRRRAGSAFKAIMDAIVAAGPAGLSLDEMMAVAERDGLTIQRPTLRSQLHHEKAKGRVVPLGIGRFAAAGIAAPDSANSLL
jgi:hypothetical protein